MDVSLDKNVDAANAVEIKLLILVVSPVTHLGHVSPSGIKLAISYDPEALASLKQV